MNDKKTALIIGGAGFVGAVLTEHLRENGYELYSVIRPNSPHRKRLDESDKGLHIIECEADTLGSLDQKVMESVDVAYYLLWTDGIGVKEQDKNTEYLLSTMKALNQLGCRRIVITGSQAEYGIVPLDETIEEDRKPQPFTAYGAAKTSACYLSRQYAAELGVEWIWGRIFSLIGKYEPRGRMLPDLYHSLQEGKVYHLSSCTQNWDYLDVNDAADALIALAEDGRNGEIYNIANGAYRPLKNFTDEVYKLVGWKGKIIYGNDAEPYVSLQPSTEKIRSDTGWYAKRSFEDSIRDYDIELE